MNSDFKGVRRSRRINGFVAQLIVQVEKLHLEAEDYRHMAEIACSEGDYPRACIHYENAFRLIKIAHNLEGCMDFYGV